ncbi:PLP-dependent cysteine synthase family protein [Syntrophothermus lipocalidus]|uniref:cysteine synthase n=1 Tax=Syntrophothermus lipocalidus (strain DSM 12680 / TGB-C1) TaxID=643648 RepID=D7CP06_SYNLT|nr:PLP-dependent cysteine synthase family protein [Syntrophothermus lipocalidus]ADI02441.1 Pyridoxal-5'-phosphate-dependent protein beta subunit [Syntrophothermus lipocalidus DSM 12680]HOV43748.1 PLP-dependent cysteine synthase family protein [Syntrophothermus lipocalidus]
MNWNRNQKMLDNVLQCIGLTPLVRLNRLAEGLKPVIAVKLEYTNPSGSLKDRVVYQIVEDAEKRGELKPGMILLEGTTGNTGIATCMVGAAKGYKVIIVMPEGMSEERKKTILAYGAELVLTPGAETDVDLVLEEVERQKQKYPGRVFEVGQFVRSQNVESHYETTGPEIWEQTGGTVDVFIMCQGTGGTVTGTAKFLKEKNPNVKVFISEPIESPILAEGRIGQHKIQGIADGLIPPILDFEYIDGIIQVPSDEAIAVARDLASKEGMFCGISSGCNVAAALKAAKVFPDARCIVTVINDNGLRYFSTELCGVPRTQPPLDREYKVSDEDWIRIKSRNLTIIR